MKSVKFHSDLNDVPADMPILDFLRDAPSNLRINALAPPKKRILLRGGFGSVPLFLTGGWVFGFVRVY